MLRRYWHVLCVVTALVALFPGLSQAQFVNEFQVPTVPFGIAAKDPIGAVPPSSSQPLTRRLYRGPRNIDLRLVAPKFRFEKDNAYHLWLKWEGRRLHTDFVWSDHGLHQLNVRTPTELFGVKFDPGVNVKFSEDGSWPTTFSLQGRTRISENVFRPTKANTDVESGMMEFEAWRELPLHGRSKPLYRYSMSLPPFRSGRIFGLQAEQVLIGTNPVVDYPTSPASVIRGRPRRNMYDPLPMEIHVREFVGPFMSWPAHTGMLKLWFAARNNGWEWFFRISYQNFR